MYDKGQNKGQTQQDQNKQILSDEYNRGGVRQGQKDNFGQGNVGQNLGNKVGEGYGKGDVSHKAPSR
jgi:hypothetical protein